MNALVLRQIDSVTAQFSRRLGAGASLAFSAQGMPGELTLQALVAAPDGPWSFQYFDSAIGPFAITDGEAILSFLGELPVTLAGTFEPWYWPVVNQQLSPAIAELLCPLQPLSDNTALPAGLTTCRIQVRLGEQRLHGLIRAEASMLLRLLDRGDWTFQQPALDEHWPVSQPLELARLSLSLAQLASLQPGDVLLPPLCHFDSEGNGRLQLAGRQWAVQTDSHERQLYVRLSHEEYQEHVQ